jgi:hypothetical protein
MPGLEELHRRSVFGFVIFDLLGVVKNEEIKIRSINNLAVP